MKELIRAKEIHDKINQLDREIKDIESYLEDVISENLDGSIRLTVNRDKKEKLKFDEDGSITSIVDRISPVGFFSNYNYPLAGTGYEADNNKEDGTNVFKSPLSETEMIMVLAALLRYRQDSRRKLVREFNDLDMSLKIK